MSVRKILVAKMGTAGKTMEIGDAVFTYKALAEKAGFSGFAALMADGMGYVNPDDVIAPTVTTIIISAPKFEAGAGIPVGLHLVDDAGNEYVRKDEDVEDEEEFFPEEEEEAVEEAASVREVLVAKMGQSGKKVAIPGVMTYRAVVELAGFESFTALMVDGKGYVNPDDVLGETVTTIILSAPKFEAGGLPSGLHLVDDAGNEYVRKDEAVEDEEEEEEVEDVDEEVPEETVREVLVAKMGQSGKKVAIPGVMTYRAVVELAGFESFTALMVDGKGYVNPDDVLGDTVTTIILSAPKFEAGL